MRTLLLVVSVLTTLALLAPAASAAPLAGADPSAPTCDDAGGVDLAAGTTDVVEGVDLPLPITEPPPPVAALASCPGIRPGARHSVEGSGCTFNFVFRGTSRNSRGELVDEGLFIGTAGHCVFDGASGPKVYAPGTGRVVTDAGGKRVGEVAYGVDEGPLDFALIRIDRNREGDVNPRVCHFGGPTALGGGLARGTVLHHFGYGLGFGSTVQGRSGVVDRYSDDGTVLNWNGAASPGDSGSSVIDASGRAVGVLVRLSPIDTGVIEATDLRSHLLAAEAATGIDLDLVTAAFSEEAPPVGRELPPIGVGLLPGL